MFSFLNGILLGYALVVPVGPITVLIVKYAMQSQKRALCFSFGALSADFVYFCLVGFGVLKFLNNDLFMKMLSIFGASYLSYLSYMILKTKDDFAKNSDFNDTHNSQKTLIRSYLNGIFLGFSNPYAILFWISVAAAGATNDNFLLTVFGFFISAASWLIFLSAIVSKYRQSISIKMARAFAYFSFAVLMFFVFKLILKIFS